MRPFCEDGRTFILKAADSVLGASEQSEYAAVVQKGASKGMPTKTIHIPIPPTISHFVMNLPASAIEFLGCYRGLYAGREALFEPTTGTKLPMIHVHCFSHNLDDDTPPNDICERITKEIGVVMKPGNAEVEGEVAVHDVRTVAPRKRMFCASFRLPREVAFAPRG